MILFLWMKRWRIQQSTWSSTAATTATRGNRDLYLIVILCSALIYLACIISPPHLQDDVDAVQAQIARNMLTLRRLGNRPAGRRSLP